MLSPGFVLPRAHSYGVVKTETVFGFGPNKNFHLNGVTSSAPLELFLGERNFGRSFEDSNKSSQTQLRKLRNKNIKIAERRNRKKHSKHKVKKCIYKLLKGKRKKLRFLKKKFLLPLLIGFVAAKILFLTLALKLLAFVSFKGLLIGFISATLLSLKGALSHSYGYHHRRYDHEKQIENIFAPSKNKESSKEYHDKNNLLPISDHKVFKFTSKNKRKH